MSNALKNLEPKKVFDYFERICSVPHGSGNTKIISDMLVNCAKELGLEYRQDSLNNVIIKKPGSKGKENCEPVILQGHMDMVAVKDADSNKDMTSDGLDLIIDGDWLKAEKTSLGGDDGIAVAIALAVLADDTLIHPPIEAVFTVDEEVGMDGAFGIDLSDIKGRRMLNIDSEEEGVFTVSCAGGVRADCAISGNEVPVDFGERLIKVKVSGLLGGHSGCEIEKGRGNANKLLARFLYDAAQKFEGMKLCRMNGGRFDNVICAQAEAVIAVPAVMACHFAKLVNDYNDMYRTEYASSDSNVTVSYSKDYEENIVSGFDAASTLRVLRCLFVLPQGVQEMSMDIKGLPQTSLNMGVLEKTEGKISFSFSIRSSISSQKMMVLDQVKAIVESAGGSVSTRGLYPGWAYRRESKFRDTLAEVFEEQNGSKPGITATHGGLECGLFIDKLPGLDCVSIGPDLRDIHSTSERMSISSVDRLYRLITAFLERLE